MPSTHPEDVINSVSDLFFLFEKRWTVPERAIFRGEPVHYPNNLCPSIFRIGTPIDEFGSYERFLSRYSVSSDRDYMFDRLFPGVSPLSLSAVALG